MYRFAVIIGSALSAVLCAFAIYFQIMALAKWRADDLFRATRITDFTTLGTCVEVITADQVGTISDGGCSGSGADEELTGSLGNLRNTLAVSVHGLYYAYQAAGAATNWELKAVATSVITSTIHPTADSIGRGVNFTVVKGALEQVAESGVPGYVAESWYGLYAPAGTPTEVVARLNAAIRKAARSETFSKRIADEGIVVIASPPEELARYVAAEQARWGQLVREAHIQLD